MPHRRRRIAALAATAFACCPAIAQEAAERPGFIEILHLTDNEAADKLRPVLSIGDEEEWASSADYPAELRAEGVNGYVRVRLSVDAAGAVTGCIPARSAQDPRLQQLACKLVRERGKFRHALALDGVPVAAEIDVQVSFELDRPLRPPAPPALPPRDDAYAPSLKATKLPDWDKFAPRGKPSGEVALSLSVYLPDAGSERRRCGITSGSGNEALDAATCDAATKTGEYAALDDIRHSNSMLMLVRWTQGKARVEYPSRERVTPLAIAGGDAAVHPPLPPGAIAQRGWARTTFLPNGKVGCLIVGSTGSDATDRAICAHLQTKITFTPQEDLFGRKVKAVRYFRYDP